MESGISSSPEIRFIRLPEVLSLCGKSKSSVYLAIKNGEFPAPVKLSARSSAWIQSEVTAWAAARIRASRPVQQEQK